MFRNVGGMVAKVWETLSKEFGHERDEDLVTTRNYCRDTMTNGIKISRNNSLLEIYYFECLKFICHVTFYKNFLHL